MLLRFVWIAAGGVMGAVLLGILIMGGRVQQADSGAVLSVLQVFAQQVQATLPADFVIKEEKIYLCGDSEETARKTAASLGIKTARELQDAYNGSEYTTEIFKDQALVKQKVNDFCSYHRSFRHLGIHNNYLAVYQGPLGYQHKLLKVERSFPMSSLSAAFQVKLQQAMEYHRMTPETQAKLRYELEFANEEALNAILENLDEMQD
ncbi:hypothetical protein [Desulforamulus hydrothermalis]|uniref:Bypass of forespore C C-terminal domain-containing protein n=1 Tax=Desulforamulus hydrothermalis Lam5 = DSM 18033 TaxID=1121428 RepID=K8DXB2_9FIRM|nr:hypothetical protein [Desulforamulus hydrothermalis]CCO07232.1 conserved exported hypothetical protein [Desulforamulus hydrothermalis Lam5 = DSM 18033]SHG87474.1 hypothetical protein SAMN02745177_00642 [Desulforamulus hydrothermalis Lam5 = DSM 18033]